MAQSSTISSGDLATATQYNNLRDDVLSTSAGHMHDGSNGRLHTDDTVFIFGTSSDVGVVLRSTALNANTALTGVAEGTPASFATAANSWMLGNVTNDGDIHMLVSKAGTSHSVFFADGSTGDTYINAATGRVINLSIAGTAEVAVSGSAMYPVTDDGQALGIVNSNEWSDLFMASGAVINFNNSDVTVTHSANTLTVGGGNVAFGSGTLTAAAILANSNDSGAIGASGTAFSDLFLASGGVINFYAGDVTLTHSSNTLTLGGGVLALGANSLTAGSILANSDNVGAIGASGTAWSDLFLASGGVVNFNAGDVTLTHSANTLTLGGGDLALGTNALTGGGTWSVGVDATGSDGTGLSANGTLRFGASQDLRMYHGGTHNYITGVTGDLVITTDGGSAAGIILDSEDDTVEIKGSGTLQATFSAAGLNLVASDNLSIGGVDILADSSGTLTLSNVDQLDATTEATIEGAIDTLANLTSIQSRTVTLADAGADAILGWDDTASAYENLTQAEVLAVIGDASTSAKGVAELATTAETSTGSDTARLVTPDGLAGSVHGEKVIQMVVVDFGTALTTGNGKFYFHVPSTLNGMDIVSVHAEVISAPAGSTIIIQLRNVTHSADILSTLLTIDASETGSDTAAAAAAIDGSEDDLATNDVIAVDIDQVGSSTAGSGLLVTVICRLP